VQQSLSKHEKFIFVIKSFTPSYSKLENEQLLNKEFFKFSFKKIAPSNFESSISALSKFEF
jgi:hypothetical protein